MAFFIAFAMRSSDALLVQYGGMDASTRGKPEDYVNLDFLPAN